ncbi:adenosylcobalamin-dependent ribonucleoside-diphosphate reductase [Candidatus Woesearchaeota archaeon]|jgi:ribonucleoside-diphosphate reductase alpha chain|nr:adenosylcobalamin-dependent ribonucleoside-diphosphate reductase [Candidatus Woesearchaeota archaeon]
MVIKKIRKRDGRFVEFDKDKIAKAIYRAAYAVGGKDKDRADYLATLAFEKVNKSFKTRYPTVEEVQDTIERILIENHHIKTAKAYILYREKQARIRDLKKSIIGTIVSKDFSFNALKIMRDKYLLNDENGILIETPEGMFRRVAKTVAKADEIFQDFDAKETEEHFYEAMKSLSFIPNSPTLMNSGTKPQQLSACFVLPIEDSVEGIYTSLRNAAIIYQSGGGTGFNFSKLRPKGDSLKFSKGGSSGPVPFMKLFDKSTEIMKKGGKKRGANMGILSVDHPDIFEFITSKENQKSLNNFNISVGMTTKFMEAVKRNNMYELINPKNAEVVRKIPAREVFDLLSTMAWKNGEPGVVFIDRINKYNSTPEIGEIESTSPCGEVLLLPYESCNLGSINLYNVVDGNSIDFDKLKKLIYLAVHFLDNVIEVNQYPLKEIEEITKANRKIGLGVMGFSDMLYALGIKYDSEEGLKTAEKIMKFISEEARNASIELANKRGVFPNWKKSIYAKGDVKLRNASLLSIAPTGSISLIADCSSSIEPNFALSYIRKVMGTEEFLYVNKHFATIAREKDFYSDELMKKIASLGSVQSLKEIPRDVRDIFVTSHDISAEYHVKMQATFQKYVDNAVSKSVNLKNTASKEDVGNIFMTAYDLGCKGITIYRDGSRSGQILNIDLTPSTPRRVVKKMRVVKDS